MRAAKRQYANQLKFWRTVGGWVVSRPGASGASLGGGLWSISGPRVTIRLRS